MKIEQKIMDILNASLKEDVSYEIVGGPDPSTPLQTKLDYARNVQPATVPQANPIPGVGTVGNQDAESNAPVTVINAPLGEDEDLDDEKKDHDGDDDEDDKKELEETFASLLVRLAEEDEIEEDADDEAAGVLPAVPPAPPKPTLPGVEIVSLDQAKLVTPAPGVQVAEDEEGVAAPVETLPDVDSFIEDPEKLVTPAPGVQVAEDEDKDSDEDSDDDDDDKKKDVTEDIEAMFAGSKLSEGAKEKAATIFRAAVTRRVNEEKQRVQKVATKKLKEAFAILQARSEKKQQVFESKLTGQVDNYLNYVVENWMTENRLAVERGIRAELAESFISGLKNLFVEHYIEVPESKVDVVATLGNKVTKLESKLNETVEQNVKMRASLNAYRKEEVVRAVSNGLTDVDREKLKGLAEGIEYTTRKEYAGKLQQLKESYFAKKTNPLKKEAQPLVESAKKPATTSEMEVYTQMLTKMNKD